MNVIRLSRQDNLTCERQAKFVQERITSTESNLSNICFSFGGYTKKQASLRDKSDDVAVAIHNYANSETINKSVKVNLQDMANIIASVGDHRDVLVHNCEEKIVKELCQYEVICRNAKAEVKNIYSAKDREINRRRQLNNVREKAPHDRQQISKAETELVKAVAEVSRMQKALEEHIDIFEKKKLKDIKSILKHFVTEEMIFHTRSIEIYTEAYKIVDRINVLEDLEEFRSVLKMDKLASRLETVKATVKSSPQKSVMGNFFSKSFKSKNNAEESVGQSQDKSDTKVGSPERTDKIEVISEGRCEGDSTSATFSTPR